MKTMMTVLLVGMSFLTPVETEPPTPPEPAVRFAPVHIYADSGTQQLAVFQFELRAVSGDVKIVGIEGGEHPAFREPPYYDPAAMMNDHVIVAAFNTGDELPTGRTRIATIHVQVTGEAVPEYEITPVITANAAGNEFNTQMSYAEGE